jgi:hypothetical protein
MTKTLKSRNRLKNKTMKCAITNKQKSFMVQKFLEILNTIKLFHWKTSTYSVHEATDKLHEKLEENIDRFVEVILGKCTLRIRITERTLVLNDLNDIDTMNKKIIEYKNFFINLDTILNSKRDSDLLSIRDDILADINQFLFLMSFKE